VYTTNYRKSKESKKIFSIFRGKKLILLKSFAFKSKINLVQMNQKYFLKLFLRKSWHLKRLSCLEKFNSINTDPNTGFLISSYKKRFLPLSP
jgi:hypothetical protein